jgi:hypothetical protein
MHGVLTRRTSPVFYTSLRSSPFLGLIPLRVACFPALECDIQTCYPLNAVAHCRTFHIRSEPPELLQPSSTHRKWPPSAWGRSISRCSAITIMRRGCGPGRVSGWSPAQSMKVTATPAQHGALITRPLAGVTLGFVPEWEEQRREALLHHWGHDLLSGHRRGGRTLSRWRGNIPRRQGQLSRRGTSALHHGSTWRHKIRADLAPTDDHLQPLRELEAFCGGPCGDRERLCRCRWAS